MAVFDHDIQAAIDATSLARDSGQVVDTLACLRAELQAREIITEDDTWLRSVADKIERDPDAMVAQLPDDYDPAERRGRTRGRRPHG